MPPIWIIFATAAAIVTTGVLTWILWRLNGGGGSGDGRDSE